VHIELTEMLRCPEPHEEGFLVMSTGEMRGRMVRSGILGCPHCQREYPIVRGVVRFSGGGAQPPVARAAPGPSPRPGAPVDAQSLQALLELGGPGGYVVLLGAAARNAVGLAGLMGGIHFVGVGGPAELEELPVLSLLACDTMIPLRRSVARAVVIGADRAASRWLGEAERVLLPGRRLVVEDEVATPPVGISRLAAGQGLWVGEKR
jgi:uncharacterized protein YbaR (Trm112 family)